MRMVSLHLEKTALSRTTLLLWPSLGGILLAALVLGLGIGGVAINPEQVAAILLHHGGISIPVAFTTEQDAVLWVIRLPRVLLAAMVGAALAVSGALFQGVFRNPLADPALIGVSSGAALGAVCAIVFGLLPIGLLSLPAAAFCGGLLATLAVYFSARRNGQTEVVTLLLTGIAVNAITGAATGILTYFSNDQQLRTIVFWSLGSMGGATWNTVQAAAPCIVVGLALTPWWYRALNLLTLGEREAGHLGVPTERARLALIFLGALMTGAAVAVCGIVGFVGLVVPHLIRLLVGPDHRTLVPASALGGAAILVLADLIARTAVLPSELPLGAMTALIGGPFFFWLLRRTRRQQGGWA